MNQELKRKRLKEVFGFDSFREKQEATLDAIMAGRDSFTIMPTGGGKSLCYQLPAVLMDGTCIVVSPLIALMKDQVDGARGNGIRAAYLNSSMRSDERSAVERQLFAGNLELLYLAPERLAITGYMEKLKKLKISFFAVDEAHCISEWGHDFRPDYLILARLKTEFPGVPLASFTASATERVRADIVTRLGLQNPLLSVSSFDRPNLFYQIEWKSGNEEMRILDFIKERPDESGIVYRSTRSKVDETALFLCKNGINALPYHAGMDNSDRKENQEKFNRDEANVIVATIAFGMGIDKSNVRFVIHADMPKNLEGYYQETGRAGRDGELSHCLLLYSPKDENIINYFITKIEDPAEKRRCMQKLFHMSSFCNSASCRRKAILNYFGEEFDKANCMACDICCGSAKIEDATRDAQILMSAMIRTGEMHPIDHIIDIVKGARTKRLAELKHDEIKTFGAGSHLSKEEWKLLFEHLCSAKATERISHDGNKATLTEKGRAILFGKAKFKMIRSARHDKPKIKISETPEHDESLFKRLRKLRKKIASAKNVPPFVVFSDKSLRDMSAKRPLSPFEFLEVEGVGKQKLEQYGAGFIAEIKAYLDDNPHIS